MLQIFGKSWCVHTVYLFRKWGWLFSLPVSSTRDTMWWNVQPLGLTWDDMRRNRLHIECDFRDSLYYKMLILSIWIVGREHNCLSFLEMNALGYDHVCWFHKATQHLGLLKISTYITPYQKCLLMSCYLLFHIKVSP